jgi:hypothetical protein
MRSLSRNLAKASVALALSVPTLAGIVLADCGRCGAAGPYHHVYRWTPFGPFSRPGTVARNRPPLAPLGSAPGSRRLDRGRPAQAQQGAAEQGLPPLKSSEGSESHDAHHEHVHGLSANRPAKPDTEKPEPGKPEAGPAATFTCPMHPEVKQDGPGTCPKCGMTLTESK